MSHTQSIVSILTPYHCRLGTAFLNDEFTDEFDRLSIINTTATEAIMTIPSSLLIHTSNVGQLLNSTDVIITRARLLQQSATNITSPSLTVLGNNKAVLNSLHVCILRKIQSYAKTNAVFTI